MSVIRINKTKNYTVMSNYHLREKEMSLKAKGLLSLMLSLPDDWDYSIRGLVAICKENEGAIKSTLKELKKFGYLKITKLMPDKSKTGRIEYVYDIYEKPKQEVKKQEVENQPLEIQQVENSLQLNTNILNTKKLNTKNKKYNIYSPASAEQRLPFKEIIDYLNSKAGTNYRYTTSKTQSLIKARFKEGFLLEDFITVIDKKYTEWHNTEMEQYLRPETLFGTKFESYLNQKIKPKKKKETLDDIFARVEKELNDERRAS